MADDRNKQVARIIRIIQLFSTSRNGFTISELLQRLIDDGFDCKERTVYRDLAAIEKVHFPIEKDGATYKLKEGSRINIALDFSYPELLALYIARNSLGTLSESPLQESLDSLFQKVDTTLGKGIDSLASELNPFFNFHLTPRWGAQVPSEVMSTIEKGCAEGHALKIEYRSPSSEPGWGYADLKIGPEYIIFTHDGAYLYAKRLDSNDFRLYAFPRIRTAVLLEEPYEPQFQGDEKVHKDSFGVLTIGDVKNVEIEIAEPIASYVAERKWHASQQVIRTEKGITLNLEVRINDEFARWVLGLGPSAKVISPTELKTQVISLAQQITQGYAVPF